TRAPPAAARGWGSFALRRDRSAFEVVARRRNRSTSRHFAIHRQRFRHARGEPALDGIEHLADLDVEQAHLRKPAAAKVMALAYSVPGHGLVDRRHWSVARRTRRPVDAD